MYEGNRACGTQLIGTFKLLDDIFQLPVTGHAAVWSKRHGGAVGQVVCKVRAHVEKAPFGLRIPLELFLWSEMQRTVTILLSVINSRIQQYLKNRALVSRACPCINLNFDLRIAHLGSA